MILSDQRSGCSEAESPTCTLHALKGPFVDLARGFLRVIGLTKTTLLLGFTVAAYNLDRIRSFRAKHRLPDEDDPHPEQPPSLAHRAKRRFGTWADLLPPSDSG